MSSFGRRRFLVDDGTRRPRVRLCGRVPWRAWLAAGVVLLLFVLASAPSALADRSFTTRFNADVPGNITMAANTLMVCPAAASGCTAARSTPPIASGSNNGINNNNYNMVYVTTGPPGTVRWSTDLRLVLGDVGVAADRDGVVRGAVLGCGYECGCERERWSDSRCGSERGFARAGWVPGPWVVDLRHDRDPATGG